MLLEIEVISEKSVCSVMYQIQECEFYSDTPSVALFAYTYMKNIVSIS